MKKIVMAVTFEDHTFRNELELRFKGLILNDKQQEILLKKFLKIPGIQKSSWVSKKEGYLQKRSTVSWNRLFPLIAKAIKTVLKREILHRKEEIPRDVRQELSRKPKSLGEKTFGRDWQDRISLTEEEKNSLI